MQKVQGAGKQMMTPRLLEKYRNEIVPKMMETLGYKNRMQVPRITKIVINMGVGEAAQDPKILESAVDNLNTITGQKSVITAAKKAISNFKIREGSKVGCRVTLRRRQMYEFLDRLVNVAMPRIKDFKGVSNDSFDDHGNYNIGLREQLIFPEIEYDKVTKISGMNVTIVTDTEDKKSARELLKLFGMPFKEK